MLLKQAILFLFSLAADISSRHSSFAAAICPEPIVDDIGVNYNAKERFDNIRKQVGNKLVTTFVHHRKTDEEYDYTLTFCGEVNSTAVEQYDKKMSRKKTTGRHDGASVLVGAEDWLLVQYLNGDKYHSHCNKQKMQAWVSIRCEDQGEKPTLRVIEEARFPNGPSHHPDKICYFLFEFNHPAACSHKKKPLSGGAVFCIILIVVAAAYFIGGFVYQRFVVRASGLDQVPNYSFWKKFGNTMADGCDFVCRTKEVSNSYKGITDDLDIESSDDDRDGLLPM